MGKIGVPRVAGLRRFFSSNLLFVLSLLWVPLFLLVHFWPDRYWLEVRRVHVFDAPPGAEVILDVDRAIHRSFTAEWSVLVRRWQDGGWVIVCTGRGKSDYRPDALLPDPLTLRWWTDEACPTLDAGRYFISTIWTIRGGAMPDKVIQTASNVFTVE
jgi:hypothetical protein